MLGLNKLFVKDVVHNVKPVINLLITVCYVMKDSSTIKENVLKIVQLNSMKIKPLKNV
jgi:hypothetical protein